MEPTSCRPALCETAVRRILAWIAENRVPLFSSLLFGFLAHGYAFTNKLINHDEAYNLFSKGATLSSGRWGLKVTPLLLPDVSMPWIYGILTIVLLSIAVCLIVKIFRVENKLFQGLLAGAILVFPSLTATMLYMYTVTSYAIAFLMAVAAVRLLQERSWLCRGAALGLMILSVSIYQAYISIAASLLVLLLVRDLMLDADVPATIRKGVAYVLFLALSLGLYYSLTKVFMAAQGSGFNAYASGSISFSLQGILTGVYTAYKAFLRFFLDHYRGLIPTNFAMWMHFLCIAATGVLFLLWLSSRKKPEIGRLLLLGALLLVFPLAVGCMYLFTTDESIHTLVLYGFVALYVLFILTADVCASLPGLKALPRKAGSVSTNLLSIGLALIIAGNIYVANTVYLNQTLRYETVYGFYSSLSTQLKMTPEFREDTKLAVIGEYEMPWFYQGYMPYLNEIEGAYNFTPTCHASQQFLQYFLDLEIPFASGAEMAEIEGTEEFAEMSLYPYYGSTKMIGDVLVVKLS